MDCTLAPYIGAVWGGLHACVTDDRSNHLAEGHNGITQKLLGLKRNKVTKVMNTRPLRGVKAGEARGDAEAGFHNVCGHVHLACTALLVHAA